jgi:hypothetical protein
MGVSIFVEWFSKSCVLNRTIFWGEIGFNIQGGFGGWERMGLAIK